MFVKQLSVFIENREGRLKEVLQALKNNGVNIVSMSLADGLSQNVGVEKSITVVVSLILSIFLVVWIKKSGLSEKYGLKSLVR